MSITGQNLSIVIVTLKSEDVIFKCLESIDSKIPIFIVENSNNLQFKKHYDWIPKIQLEKGLKMTFNNQH